MRLIVAGASSQAGRSILNELARAGWAPAALLALTGEKSAGSELSYGEEAVIATYPPEQWQPSSGDILLLASPRAAPLAKQAEAAGLPILDAAGLYRRTVEATLILPDDSQPLPPAKIYSLPSPVAVALATLLRPLATQWPVTRLVVATYQAVAELGREAMDELFAQTRAVFVHDPLVTERLPRQIAFNVIPLLDELMADGQAVAEWSLSMELKRLVARELRVSMTGVRVPCFVGDGLAVNLSFADEVDAAMLRPVLARSQGLQVTDARREDAYVTPIEVAGEEQIFISRLRDDSSADNSVNLWLTYDAVLVGIARPAARLAIQWAQAQALSAKAQKKQGSG